LWKPGSISSLSELKKLRTKPTGHFCSPRFPACAAKSDPSHTGNSKTGISAPTVAKSLEHMRRLGILNETTGRERHGLFVYEPYLAILNEGTEPIR